MHEMWTIVTDVSICPPVCQFGIHMSAAKKAEQIKSYLVWRLLVVLIPHGERERGRLDEAITKLCWPLVLDSSGL